jgi:hypothetical protein
MMPVSPVHLSLETINLPVMPAPVIPLQRVRQVGIRTKAQPAERLQRERL